MRITHYFKTLSQWLMPYTCILCHFPSKQMLDLCEPCHNDLPILTHFCRRCAAYSRFSSRSSTHLTPQTPPQPILFPIPKSPILCPTCSTTPPPFDITHALFAYESNIKRLILNLKFQQDLVNARILGELLAKKIQRDWYQDCPMPSVIIPMPLHIKRLNKRGFNQSLEIARPISRQLKLPIDIHACERVKYTKAQATLPAEERIKNVTNAFVVRRDFSDQHIALLDDVITTGHTITELARAFKQAGAARIDIWCCARGVMKHQKNF